MTMVERQHAIGPITPGEQHQGCVRQADPLIGVPLDELARTPDILDPERRELPGPAGQLAERRNRRGLALASGEQVIELSQNIR
jgi:hypothetical protein